ncbi:MAG: hypothetical protein ACRDI0_08920 [Actinomycetota bacterium]
MPWAEVEFGLHISAENAALSIEELNKMFYARYPRQYFKSALQLAAASYHDPVQALSPLSEQVHLKGEPDEGVLQMQVTVEPDEVEAIRETARLQIVSLYFHSLETFLRLFLAHAPGIECPWMQLVRDEGPPFVAKLKQLEDISATWESGEKPEDEHVLMAFFPVRDPEPGVKAAFGNAKSWLRFAAQECRRARVHNAFKHGISVRSGEPGLAVFSRADPRTEAGAKPVVEWSGEALITLARVKRPDRSRDWVMEHRKLPVTETIGIVFLVQRWIQAILDVGELRYLNHRPADRIDVPNVSYEELIERIRSKKESSPPWGMTSFTMPIGWADLPPAPPEVSVPGSG